MDTGPYRFTHVMEDIQTLNERATRGELDITAISIHAYAYVLDKSLLPAGASMGFGYGPMVVAKQKIAPGEPHRHDDRHPREDDVRLSRAPAGHRPVRSAARALRRDHPGAADGDASCCTDHPRRPARPTGTPAWRNA